ncbi:protein of unknown function DUF1080 [Gemmatirosa kalamazoonensis]|uniref:3-keto-alpha-glucoside-1,2-lyase/3-keto-2-hydroxy-glucal hydratase domain-containing protein n=1 Tax=Gemmatirosa kalamazoonensis TaxID=861299 RepID=W0RR54_9BACT|nr:DUF1080 domain-containing protein [Gemmatirosa kalamazoonensis]AHG92063.1 protein of unknown function DUF1080 [Gemmatirosa kalamazoonensis]
MTFRPRSARLRVVVPAIAALLLSSAADAQQPAYPSAWRQHELNRPHAKPVTPASTPGAPPSDATVLFDGRDLSAFVGGRGDSTVAPRWKVENGYVEVVPRTGSIRTKEAFGDVQLHAEWAEPDPPQLTGQNRGNSGMILMGQYEVQVLDSYGRTDTYADGTVGAIYGQYPPLANASRPPGQWQTYDIYFRRPRFRADGTLQEPARVTVVQNGVLVQNNEIITGPTSPIPPSGYVQHADELPLTIQDHGQAIRFRNIWVRRIEPRPEPPAGYVPNAVALSAALLNGTAGEFYRERAANAPAPANAANRPASPTYTIIVKGSEIWVSTGGFGGSTPAVRAIPTAPDRLWLTVRTGELVLTRDAQGRVTSVREADSNAPAAVRRE